MFAIYGEAKIPADGKSVSELKNILSSLYPEVVNYQEYTDAEGNIRFRPVGGNKGAQVALYGEATIPAEGKTVAELKNILSSLYPEVINYQDYVDADGNIRFRPVGGNKGI